MLHITFQRRKVKHCLYTQNQKSKYLLIEKYSRVYDPQDEVEKDINPNKSAKCKDENK